LGFRSRSRSGALFAGPLVALVPLLLRRYRLALAALAATVLKLGL
jgi:hypothetical protein